MRFQILSRDGLQTILQDFVGEQVRLKQIVAKHCQSIGSILFAVLFDYNGRQDEPMRLYYAKNGEFVAGFLRQHEDGVALLGRDEDIFAVLRAGNRRQTLLVLKEFQLLQKARR